MRGEIDIGADEVQFYASRGTPYWWLEAYAQVTNNYEQADGADTDMGGASTWQEFIADTHPTNAGAVLAVTVVSNLAAIAVFFESSAGRVYSLVCRDRLTGGGTWTDVPGHDPRPGVDGPDSMTDTNSVSTRLYRVTVALP